MKRLLPLLLVLLLQNFAFGQQMPDTADVVAWWPICNDMIDHRQNGYDLLSVNTSFTFDVHTNANSALDFDGVTSEAYYTTNIPLTNFFTYTCWIYPRTNQNSIIFYNGDPSLNGFGLTMSDGAGGPGNKVSVLLGGVIANQLPTAVSLNTWHHLALVRNGNAYLLYVDSVSQGFFIDIMATPLTNRFTLGMDDVAGNRNFDGRIDDISSYKTNLSLNQIKNIYHFDPVAPYFSLGADTIVCETYTNICPSPPPAPEYVRAWSKSSGGTVTPDPSTGCVNAPPPLVGSPETYTMCSSKILGCSLCVNKIIKHAIFNVHLGLDQHKCIGDSVVLQANGGSSASYIWNTGSTSSTITANSTGSYYVRVDSATCIAKDTVYLSFSPHPVITLADSVKNCNGDSIILGPPGVYDTVATYLWVKPGGSIGTSDTVTARNSGYYHITVTVRGCPSTDSMYASIVYDTFTLRTRDAAICRGQDTTVVLTSGPGLHYQWTPTAGITHPFDTSATPTIHADTSAMYYVTVSSGACYKTDSFFLDVQPIPSISMGGNRYACRHDSIRLAPTVTPSWYTHFIYDWTPGYFMNDSALPVVSYTSPNTGTYKLYFTVSNSAGCSKTDSMLIFVHDDSLATLDTFTQICQGTGATFMPHHINTLEAPFTYAWHSGLDFIDSTSATPTAIPHTSTSYIGIITSKWGCHDTLNARVVLLPQALVAMPDSVILHTGESYQISPSTNCSRFSWYPGLGLTDTSISDPVASPVVSTMFIVKAKTEDGCSVTDSIKIVIDPLSVIDAPNAFVPGGINSKFRLIRKGLAVLNYFRIFDRWGNMVYESKDIDAGWDGMYKNIAQPAGVYVYEVEAVTDLGKIYHKQGNITLLR